MYSAFQTLREANLARQIEWDPSDQITLAYTGNEFAGEVGEAVEAAEMLDKALLAQEIGDVIICADLIAMRMVIDLDVSEPTDPKPYMSRGEAISDLAIATGGVCNTIKKLERERLGLAGSRTSVDHLAMFLRAAVVASYRLGNCSDFTIAVDRAVADKFNLTSQKVGLNTRLLPPIRIN